MYRVRDREVMMVSIIVLAILALAKLSAHPVSAARAAWMTYNDPRYNFTVEYPSGWTVVPRNDQEGTYGGALRFVEGTTQTTRQLPGEIVVGLHTLQREPNETLAQWTKRYLQLSSPFGSSEIQIDEMRYIPSLTADGQVAFAISGTSPLTKFRLVNIPRGDTVWFIWANVDEATSVAVYERVVQTLRFAPHSPSTLEDAFGPVFQPVPRQATEEVEVETEGVNAVLPLPDNTWVVPIPAGVTYNVLCGSSYHTGTAAYAADVQLGNRTAVHSAKRSWVDFAGWDSTGYGFLIKTSTDFLYSRVYIAYYAHLDSFAISPGQEASTTKLIAYSGNSGTSGYHLHFHAFNGNDPVDLRNLINFAENSHWPSGYANCGTMSR